MTHTMKIAKNTLTLVLVMTAFTLFAEEKRILYSEVPAPIKSYVTTHFSSYKVVKSSIDFEGLSKKYEIILSNGVKLEFDKKGKVTEIDSHSKLPDSVIPKKIQDYVQRNFPESYITDWSLKKKYQQIELDNGLELDFTLKGDFIRIDN